MVRRWIAMAALSGLGAAPSSALSQTAGETGIAAPRSAQPLRSDVLQPQQPREVGVVAQPAPGSAGVPATPRGEPAATADQLAADPAPPAATEPAATGAGAVVTQPEPPGPKLVEVAEALPASVDASIPTGTGGGAANEQVAAAAEAVAEVAYRAPRGAEPAPPTVNVAGNAPADDSAQTGGNGSPWLFPIAIVLAGAAAALWSRWRGRKAGPMPRAAVSMTSSLDSVSGRSRVPELSFCGPETRIRARLEAGAEP